MSKHIVCSVVNDLTYDQRMQRICTSLTKAGYQVTLIGRENKNGSKPLKKQVFEQIRFRLFFHKGKLFYIEYNLRLLWHFLTHKYDIFSAADLDTLVPHFLAAKIKGKPHVYDAHEYFAELPEVVHRPFVRWVWKTVERFIVPRTQHAYTINHSYAQLFENQYPTPFQIVRNATVLQETTFPKHKKERYILYQGAVNVGRGVEEMIQAMPYIDCQLYICGKGDVFDDCVALAERLGVSHKVKFWGFIPPEELRSFTLNATLGFTFFTNDGLSYYHSLANRFFDYFHAGVPQLCVNFPAYRQINQEFEIAVLLDDLKIETIVTVVNQLLTNEVLYERLQKNCLEARQVINWQEEEKKLVALYQQIVAS